MGPRYVSKYEENSEKPEIIHNNKRVNEDYERGELGSSSTTTSSGTDESDTDSNGEDNDSQGEEDKQESPQKDYEFEEFQTRPTYKRAPSSSEMISKPHPPSIPDAIVSSVGKHTSSASSVTEDELKKLELEIKRLKDQLTESEAQRLNQKKQYQSKISSLVSTNEQLISMSKQLTGVIETTSTKLTSDQSREKELCFQIQQGRSELSTKQEEMQRYQEMNKMLMKTMDIYKQKFEEKEFYTYRQTNQLLSGQIILWIFVVVIFVIVFSLFIKQSSRVDL